MTLQEPSAFFQAHAAHFNWDLPFGARANPVANLLELQIAEEHKKRNSTAV